MGIPVSNIMRKQNYASACTYLYEYESKMAKSYPQGNPQIFVSIFLMLIENGSQNINNINFYVNIYKPRVIISIPDIIDMLRAKFKRKSL